MCLHALLCLCAVQVRPTPCLLPEVQVSALLVVASMWGTLTTISPTNPLIRWPELAKSNLREADGEAEQRRRRRKVNGGWRGRGHCTVRVNQGTHEPLPSDHHPNNKRLRELMCRKKGQKTSMYLRILYAYISKSHCTKIT